MRVDFFPFSYLRFSISHLQFMFFVLFSLQVSARNGELGIIPGSMGAQSFIVKGKGNPESFYR